MPRPALRLGRPTVIAGALTLACVAAVGVYLVSASEPPRERETSTFGPHRLRALGLDPDRPQGGDEPVSRPPAYMTSAPAGGANLSVTREPVEPVGEPDPDPTAEPDPEPTATPARTATPPRRPRPVPADRPRIFFVTSGELETGYVTLVRIANSTDRPLDWNLRFTYDTAVVNGQWQVDLSQSGEAVTARGVPGNATIPPGAEVSFGFSARGRPEVPKNCTLNGQPCRIG